MKTLRLILCGLLAATSVQGAQLIADLSLRGSSNKLLSGSTFLAEASSNVDLSLAFVTLPVAIRIPSAAGNSGLVLSSNGTTWVATSGGSGSVTTISVVTANGVSATITNATTTPALTFTLGAITPTSVNGLTFTAASAGFTIAGGTSSKTLTISNTLTLAGTDGSTLNIGTGGTLGSAAYTATSAYQAADTDVAALAANSTNGLWARTGSGTGAARTLTGTSNQVTVTNGDGVSGNPTFSLPQDIATTSLVRFGSLGLGGAAPSNGLKLYGSTAATNTTSGELQVVGGVGIGGAVHIGGGGSVTGEWLIGMADAGTITLQVGAFTDFSNALLLSTPVNSTPAVAGYGPQIGFSAHNGSAAALVGSISFRKENATVGNNAYYLRWELSDASAAREVARINSDGELLIGTSTDGGDAKLQVSGNATVSGTLSHAGGSIGAATATTASADDNDTSVATTAYVQGELTAYASDTATLTNKRITARVGTLTVTSNAITPNIDTHDGGRVTSLSAGLTINLPSGTPTDWQVFRLGIKSAAPQTLTWDAGYEWSDDLSAVTSTSGDDKWDYFLIWWNAIESHYEVVSKIQGFQGS